MSETEESPLLLLDSTVELSPATENPDNTAKVVFTKHRTSASSRDTQEPESSNTVLRFSGAATKETKSNFCTYCRISIFTIICTALIIILLLTYELQLNCPTCTAENTARKRSLDSSIKFLVASDLHFDSYYNDTLSVEPTFCRRVGNYSTSSYKAPYGRVGCDSPAALIDSWLSKMQKVHGKENAEFMLLTGDFSAHNTGAPYFRTGTTAQRVMMNIRTAMIKIHKAFPQIPIFPILGNNDFAEHNTLPVSDEDTWYQDTLDVFAPMILCNGCPSSQPKPTTLQELKSTFLDGGYYKATIAGGRLVLLALNSMYWYVHANVRSAYIQSKALKQMTWLKNQLHLARQHGKKVIVASHVPPGVDPFDSKALWLDNYTRMYADLVAGQYHDVIAGQIYGHVHKDDFKLQSADTHSPASSQDRQLPVNKSFALLVPSLSVVYANNPAFRQVYLDPVKQVLLDYDQYFMDIVMATEFQSPDWQLDYRFSQHYPSLSQYIDAERIYKLNQNLIKRFNKQPWMNYVVSRAVNYQSMGYSRFNLYCCMRHLETGGYDKCIAKYYVSGG